MVQELTFRSVKLNMAVPVSRQRQHMLLVHPPAQPPLTKPPLPPRPPRPQLLPLPHRLAGLLSLLLPKELEEGPRLILSSSLLPRVF